MLAVGTNRSHRFVKRLVSDLFNDNLIDEALKARSDQGDTTLHYAATVRNVIDFTVLVSRSTSPVEIAFRKNNRGRTLLSVAANQGKRNKMLEFLFFRIGVLNPRVLSTLHPDRPNLLGDLLGHAIEGQFIGTHIIYKLIFFGTLNFINTKRETSKTLAG